MSKTPIIAITAVGLAAAIPVGALATDAVGASSKPVVNDFDADLVSGNRLSMTVDATRGSTVKVTYRGTTKTARPETDDDDREVGYDVRFKRASGDGAGDRVSVKVTAKRNGTTTTKTLTDRIDDERGDDD